VHALQIEHERVRENQDRSWTFALLDEAGSASALEAEQAEAFRTLAWLEDHRSVGRLTAMVEDISLPVSVRESASKALAGFDDTTTAEVRRAWWDSGDPVKMAHALRLMGRSEADIVVPVAEDGGYPLRLLALSAMAFGFDEPQFELVKIRALDHPDAEVRKAAADVLLWDEPIAAEESLLAASVDADCDVALLAIDELQYYPSRRVLRALGHLANHADGERLRAKAAESFEYNRGRFEHAASFGDHKLVALLREWMQPIADLVRWHDAVRDRDEAVSSPPTRSSRVAMPEAELAALLADPDGDWGPKKRALTRVDWESYTEAERERLCDILTAHPDPAVREIAPVPLAAWSRSEELVRLTSDPSFGVRKSAMYSLGLLPRDPALADVAWAYLLPTSGTTAHEALNTYVTHAPAADAKERALDLARSDRRESVRRTAIACLVKLGAVPELERSVPMLRDPPGVTWAVHIEIIDGLRKLGIPAPELDHLDVVDNLDLIQSISALRCSSRP
jgi:HEAT repeat protein